MNAAAAAARPAESSAQTDPRVVRTRREIADAVRDLIMETGWDAVTHQNVAERTGYARNTVYRHFPDRIDLFAHCADLDDEFGHAPRTGDVRTDLIGEMVAFRRALFEGPAGAIMSAVIERAIRDPEAVAMRDRIVGTGSAQTIEILEQAKAEGLIDGNANPVDLNAALSGSVLYARLCRDVPPTDGAIAALVDRVLA